jgi:penicillin-binding protein 2
MNDDKKENKAVNRRGFLKSIFGVGVISNSSQAEAVSPKNCSFFWCNLKTGQIGFPTGLDVPFGLPGSLAKLITAAALKEENLILPDEKLECRGKIVINNHTYSCLAPHGLVDLVHAIGLSCNIYFVQAASRLTTKTFLHYAQLFGLADSVTEHEKFKFPDINTSHYTYSIDQYATGLADDLEPNALQLMRMAALIAQEGHCVHLHSAEEKQKEKMYQTHLAKGTWITLQQSMRMADRLGTGKNLDAKDSLHLAIKTGTAPHGKKFQSWIIGYFPYESPRYAFCLRSQEGTSLESAVPSARHWLLSQPWP